MFDNYYAPTRTEYITKDVNVKEYKAPTDDSVKLLNEMQEKTLANIVKQFSVQDNEFNFGVMSYKNPVRYTTEVIIKFSLNRKQYEVSLDVDEFKSKDGQVQDIYKGLCSKLAEIFTVGVLESLQTKY